MRQKRTKSNLFLIGSSLQVESLEDRRLLSGDGLLTPVVAEPTDPDKPVTADVTPIVPSAGPIAEVVEAAPEITEPSGEPVVEANQPIVEVAEAAAPIIVEVTQPIAQAVAEVAAPAVEEVEEATQLIVETTQPVVEEVAEIAAPIVVEVAQPVIEEAEAAAPVVETTQPVVEEVAEAAAPIVEVVEAAAPVVETTQPVVEEVAEIAAPIVVEVAQPVVEEAEIAAPIVVEVAQPIVDAVEETTRPIVGVEETSQPIVEEVAEAAAPVVEAVEEATAPIVEVAEAAAPVIEVADAAALIVDEPAFVPLVPVIARVNPIIISASQLIAKVIESVNQDTESDDGTAVRGLVKPADLLLAVRFPLDQKSLERAVRQFLDQINGLSVELVDRTAWWDSIANAEETTVLSSLTDRPGGSSGLEERAPSVEPDEADVEGLVPQSTSLLTALFPFDLRSLERAIQQFLQELSDLGRGLMGWMAGKELLAWLLAVAVAAAAYEIARRERLRSESDMMRLVCEEA